MPTGLFKLMRPRQWVKNAFVFAPLMFSGLFIDAEAVKQTLIAGLLFCIASSATYVVNDMRDVESDRRHPKKSKTRPLASGEVTRPQAFMLLGLLYTLLIGGFFIQPMTMLVITAYLILNLFYSFKLKHEPVIDIFIIASGFVLRVYAGAVALDVPVSSWMFVTTLCLALYLASIKRRQELRHNNGEGREVLKHYNTALVDRYAEMSATGALVFYSLFVMSAQPDMVLTIPLVLYGLYRYWFVVEIMEGGESPTDALLGDWQLMVTVLAWAGACTLTLWFERA